MSQSVECPHCNGAVSIASDTAGKRVKCPHCDQTFLAPGVAATTISQNDDDWLKLDDEPTSVDEFAAKTEAPPAPHPSSITASFAAPSASTPLPPKPVDAAKTSQRNTNPVANSIEYATEYRVNCNICGSMMYAKAEQAGKTVRCNDCHSPITIPTPPKAPRKRLIDTENAETFQLEESQVVRQSDPYKRSADQLLQDAASEEAPEPSTNADFDTPDIKEWFRNVFGIFKDSGVLAHWLGLSAIASVVVSIVLSVDSKILQLALYPGGFFLAVLTVCCGFAILHAVANCEERITDWPTLDPFAWFEQLFVALAAAAVAAVPIWGICMFAIGPTLLSVAITMLSVFAVFPFVLLSMLDMGSVMVPFSAEVARSVTKCEESWGGFYFSSGALFAGTYFTFILVSSFGQPIGTVLSIFAAIAATFCYFSMIGRLAYAIGQTIDSPTPE